MIRRILMFIEDVVAAIGRFFLSFFDKVERVFGNGFYLLARGLRRIAQRIVPWQMLQKLGRVWAGIAAGIYSTVGVLVNVVVWLANRLVPRFLFRWFGPPVEACLDFAQHWWFSRNYLRLLGGLPAILMVMPLAVCLARISIQSPGRMANRYQAAIQKALNEDDLAGADLYRRKLYQLGAKVDHAEYATAMSESAAGDYAAAYQRLQPLAPTTEVGFLPAHVWIASMLADGLVGQDLGEDARQQLAETHAQLVLKRDKQNPLARRIMVGVLLRKGQIDEAISELESLVSTFPDMNTMLMSLYQARDNTTAARFRAEDAAEFYQQQWEEQGSEFLPQNYIQWYAANVVSEHFDEAVIVLERGIEHHPEEQALKRLMAHAAVAALTNMRERGDTDAEKWTALIKKGIEADPTNEILRRQIRQGIWNEEAAIERMLEQLPNHIASILYLDAGDLAAATKDYGRAKQLYQKSCRLDETSARAWNNLAWVIARTEDQSDLQQALKLANQALTNSSEPRFFETRGQIYVKLKRWQEAANDLERALNGTLPNSAAAHRSLALAYEALGDNEQAAAHRAQSGS